MSPDMTPGRCSVCRERAERGPSGAWWHIGPACGAVAARFEPGDEGEGAERQQQSPRNRQITDPGRDR